MSESEREMELVAGTIGGITQKKADTWTVQVKPEGSQYARNLWTKDADLVVALGAKLGEQGAFVAALGAPYTVDGKEVRSWWLQSVSDGTENIPERVATPVNVPKDPAKAALATDMPRKNLGGLPSGEGMSKEEWARKDSAIHKMACIKTAADALKHTMPSDPSTDDLNLYMTRVSHLAYAWHRSVLAERDDPAGENIPF